MSIRVHFLDDERKALYGAIFPDGVPVKGPVPTLCELGDIGEHPCYILDFQAISMEQYSALAEAISQRFGAVRVAVASQISQDGLPIRADQTTLVVDGPHLSLLMPDAVADEDDFSNEDDYEDDDEEGPYHFYNADWYDPDSGVSELEPEETPRQTYIGPGSETLPPGVDEEEQA